MRRVAILGCGPAGLIAANAAVLAGADVKILSKKRKSFMNGAQYLHGPIDGVNNGDPFTIKYQLRGSPQAYRLKVYGRQWDGNVSPEDLLEEHQGYDIRLVYDQLWNMFHNTIYDWEATPSGLKQFIDDNVPDLVISTIPGPLLCHEGHSFRSTRIWSTDRMVEPVPRNTVICNGEEVPRWYRVSNIRGYCNTEWPDGAKPPITPMWEVLKPLTHNCTCFPDIVRAGRYGKWEKGVLSHEVQDEVKAWATSQDAQ